MRLTVNGKPVETADAETLADLLRELHIEQPFAAVEVNESILRKADCVSYRLKEDDRIEFVNFVGGG